MSRVRVLHEYKTKGVLVRLQDDPDNLVGYKLLTISERVFDDYHTAMDAMRSIEKELRANNGIYLQNP